MHLTGCMVVHIIMHMDATTNPAPINPLPVIGNTCYSYLSATEAAHVNSVYRYDPEKKTLLPVEGAGG